MGKTPSYWKLKKKFCVIKESKMKTNLEFFLEITGDVDVRSMMEDDDIGL